MGIVTKNRQEFLKSEYEDYYKDNFKTYKEFRDEMKFLVDRCKECGILYWKNSSKRCDCG